MNLSKVALSGAEVSSVLGVVVPFGTALLTKLGAKLHAKSAVAIVLAALAAYAGSLAGTGPITGTQLILGFVGALAVAGGTRLSATAQLVDKLSHLTASFGIGKAVNIPLGTTPVAAPAGLANLPGLGADSIAHLSTGAPAPTVDPLTAAPNLAGTEAPDLTGVSAVNIPTVGPAAEVAPVPPVPLTGA